MSSHLSNRTAQSILRTLLTLLFFADLSATASSQTCTVPRYSHQPIHHTSWAPAMQVTVKIDSQFSAAKASEIAQGNALWNHPVLLACSGVTFSGFDSVIIPEEDLENTPARGHRFGKKMIR